MRNPAGKRLTKLSLLLATGVLMSAVSAHAQKQSTPTRASAEAVCSFITNKMMSALPQVPTLCAVKKETAELYELNVFSPTDVLEGKMRRAWSTVLFQTAQALFFDGALNGTCEDSSGKNWPGCDLHVSDSHLSSLNLYYSLWLSKNLEIIIRRYDPLSEGWYLAYWRFLLRDKKQSDPRRMSTGNAELRVKDACKAYLEALQPAVKFSELPAPACSLLFAADSNVYAVVDVPVSLDALTDRYIRPLPRTFGEEFASSAYDGAVIVRTPWFGAASDTRKYDMYPLREVSFCWEEENSGVREWPDAFMLLEGAVEKGQTDRYVFESSHKSRGNATVMKAQGVKVKDDVRLVAALTDGSVWSIPLDAAMECGLIPGVGVNIASWWESGTGILVAKRGRCVGATFLASWDEHDQKDPKWMEGENTAALGTRAATTFRGHTLGESWQTFAKTDGGLCSLSKENAQACTAAAAGNDASLSQRSEENHANISFFFERGRFVKATMGMEVPKFTELTYLEKTYGKPIFKSSNPEKGEAESRWYFFDGGSVRASEKSYGSGSFRIISIGIYAKE